MARQFSPNGPCAHPSCNHKTTSTKTPQTQRRSCLSHGKMKRAPRKTRRVRGAKSSRRALTSIPSPRLPSKQAEKKAERRAKLEWRARGHLRRRFGLLTCAAGGNETDFATVRLGPADSRRLQHTESRSESCPNTETTLVIHPPTRHPHSFNGQGLRCYERPLLSRRRHAKSTWDMAHGDPTGQEK